MPPLATTRVSPSESSAISCGPMPWDGRLAVAPVVNLGVVDTDDAALAAKVVLGGIEQPPVRAEDAVTIEVPIGRCLHPAGDGALLEVQDQGEAAGPPREMRRLVSAGTKGKGVASTR